MRRHRTREINGSLVPRSTYRLVSSKVHNSSGVHHCRGFINTNGVCWIPLAPFSSSQGACVDCMHQVGPEPGQTGKWGKRKTHPRTGNIFLQSLSTFMRASFRNNILISLAIERLMDIRGSSTPDQRSGRYNRTGLGPLRWASPTSFIRDFKRRKATIARFVVRRRATIEELITGRRNNGEIRSTVRKLQWERGFSNRRLCGRGHNRGLHNRFMRRHFLSSWMLVKFFNWSVFLISAWQGNIFFLGFRISTDFSIQLFFIIHWGMSWDFNIYISLDSLVK